MAITTTNASGATVLGGAINNNGNTLTVAGAGSATISPSGSISGGGGLTMSGGGTLAINAATTYTGDTRIVAGALTVGHPLALQGATLDMNTADGGTLSFGVPSATLGGLKGTRNLNLGTSTVSIGANNVNTTYSGSLSGGTGLIKVGTGSFTLQGSNTYGGATLINAGTLCLAPGASGGNPINLLPMGDSITAQAYYFNPLTTLLSNSGYTPTILANEGHSGYIIDGSYPGAPRPGLEENINSFMNHAGVNANNSYILLMIGTNDVDTGYNLQSTDVPNVQTRLGGLINSITTIATAGAPGCGPDRTEPGQYRQRHGRAAIQRERCSLRGHGPSGRRERQYGRYVRPVHPQFVHAVHQHPEPLHGRYPPSQSSRRQYHGPAMV